MCWREETASQGASWRNDFPEECDGYDKDVKGSPLGKRTAARRKVARKMASRKGSGVCVWGGGSNGGVRVCADASLSEA